MVDAFYDRGGAGLIKVLLLFHLFCRLLMFSFGSGTMASMFALVGRRVAEESGAFTLQSVANKVRAGPSHYLSTLLDEAEQPPSEHGLPDMERPVAWAGKGEF